MEVWQWPTLLFLEAGSDSKRSSFVIISSKLLLSLDNVWVVEQPKEAWSLCLVLAKTWLKEPRLSEVWPIIIFLEIIGLTDCSEGDREADIGSGLW